MGFVQGGGKAQQPPREVSDEANDQGTVGAQPATNEVKIRSHCHTLYTRSL